MKKECMIAFKVTKEIKDKIIKLASQCKTTDTLQPLTLSNFCRIAIVKYIDELERDKE